MLKHFNIWPAYADPNNLFESQKIFLIYLMGIIPSKEDWTIQVAYQKELQEIKSLKSVPIDQTEIDLAKIQGRDIAEIKAERLLDEKKKRLEELNKKFGIEEKTDPNIKIKFQENDTQRLQLWDILQAKGIVNKNKTGGEVKNGLQD